MFTLWLFYALPIFLGALIIAVFVRRRIRYSTAKVYCAAVVSGLFIAPMPVGTFFGMVPNGVLFFSDPGGYIQYLTRAWPWFLVSVPTSTVIFAFCLEIVLSTRQSEHRKSYQPLKRLLVGGVGVLLIAGPLTVFWPKDRSCHNVLRDGLTSISPKVTIDLDLPIENWPDLEAFYQGFAERHELSIQKGRSESTDSVKLLSLNMCREPGATIATDEQRWKHNDFKHQMPGYGVGVRVYQNEEHADWVSLARTLIAELRQTWPDRVHVSVKEGDSTQLLPQTMDD
ncbi:hypothetical protein [Denitrobaculum tricleocarpae]|uniref:Uncharacterized protein n=1 Tax=Denitrobaculum tricleocarpae TaxID=2591009 RepID=A0A545U2W6_9PROT|nr:hypothetical protein [Denitrobaculum tricleocarpae]TQV83822.1 hypothetical protein FKG95_04380 [Denitrobaculum tricleocarpae]